MSTGGGPAPARKAWHGVHKALADPLRIRLVEWLMERPRSARELAGCAGLPADRLYYHLGQLEQAGLIEVAEYRRLARGKAERVYAPAEAEPQPDPEPPGGLLKQPRSEQRNGQQDRHGEDEPRRLPVSADGAVTPELVR